MALFKCGECSREVSDQASSCPNCGYPILAIAKTKAVSEKPTNGSLVLGGFIMAVFVLATLGLVAMAVSATSANARLIALGVAAILAYVVIDPFLGITRKLPKFGGKYSNLFTPMAVVVCVATYAVFFSEAGPGSRREAVDQGTIDRSSSALEADVVTNCDAAVRTQVKNPSSLDLAWTWDVMTSGYYMVIRRNFTAMNGFGAQIDHFYRCRYDTQDNKIASLELNEGNWK